jgi:hypothetical protein
MGLTIVTIFKAFESLFIAMSSYRSSAELQEYFKIERQIAKSQEYACSLKSALSSKRLFRLAFSEDKN